jgi:hypothetical protein
VGVGWWWWTIGRRFTTARKSVCFGAQGERGAPAHQRTADLSCFYASTPRRDWLIRLRLEGIRVRGCRAGYLSIDGVLAFRPAA